MTARPGALSERAVILAPHGRDAQVASAILREAGYAADICSGLPSLCAELSRGAGLAIIVDETLHNADLRPLADFLRQQPAWSDLPVVLLTRHGGGPERNPAAARLADLLGNVTFLERPFHPTTLVSVVRTAVRGRRRQYESRARLEQLSESQQQLRTAMRAGNLGSWTLDVRHRTLHASENCLAHFGRSAEEALSYEEFHAAVHPEDRAAVQATLDQALQSRTDYAIEYRIIWPDGSTHWVDTRARVVCGETGDAEQLVGVSSDISERKTSELERERLLQALAAERKALSDLTSTLEQRVQERTEALRGEVVAREKAQEQLFQAQKMESIGQLTGGVAHDFNNLLMAMMSSLELIRLRLRDDAQVQRYIDSAVQSVQRGASLTQRMLAFARRQDLNADIADLGQLLTGMQDLLQRALGPQIALNLDIPADLPLARLDINQVELAVLNLAINARDAMPGRGTINISVKETRIDDSEDLRPGAYLELSIADTGKGMDPDTLKKAAEPFFSTKPSGKGTGLGLSMVHGLAVQLGGTLRLTSELGSGTTATLWLPVAQTEAKAAPPVPAEERNEMQSRATILVVDDDELVAGGIVSLLEAMGHTVLYADSGQGALDILAEDEVDLILTDHAMPGMTGIELATQVRRKQPDIPVLLVTGYADLPAAEKFDLPRLSKPCQSSQLQAEITRLLNA